MVTEAGSYVSLRDSCITQLKAQGPSRTCKASKEEEKRREDLRAPRSSLTGVPRSLKKTGPGSRVQGSGFMVQGSGFRVRFRVQSSGFRIQGSGNPLRPP